MKYALFGLLALTQIANSQVVDKNSNIGSLWSDSTSNPFLDRTARKAGDLLTVIISERSVSSFNAQTTASKKDSNLVSQALGLKFLTRLIGSSADTSADSKNEGKGNSQQSSNMTARLTVTVKDVLPNGNLLIEGTRTIAVNKEIQIYKLSGIVWRDNIRSDNTILSENIANADIQMTGKGLAANRQRAGILTRLLDWLF